MSENLCGNCKHWGRPNEAAFAFRSCTAAVHDAGYLAAEYPGQLPDCDDDDEAVSDRTAFRAAHKAVVVDGSGFFAALRTREDFGCVLWEEKPS